MSEDNNIIVKRTPIEIAISEFVKIRIPFLKEIDNFYDVFVDIFTEKEYGGTVCKITFIFKRPFSGDDSDKISEEVMKINLKNIIKGGLFSSKIKEVNIGSSSLEYYNEHSSKYYNQLKSDSKEFVNEEVENVKDFIGTLKSKYEISDDLVNFINNFIEKSDCQKIEFANFKYPALGAALHNSVLINNTILFKSLESTLFVIFHEIAHQYQYKKYGVEKMYEFYNDEISVNEAAKFMKEIELVADNFASRKIRELQNMGMIDTKYKPIEYYKNVPEKMLADFINSIREKLRERDITSHKDIASYLYNLIKSNV